MRWAVTFPLGIWVAEHHTIAVMLSVGTIAFELGFVASLFLPRWKTAFFAAALAFHVGLHIGRRPRVLRPYDRRADPAHLLRYALAAVPSPDGRLHERADRAPADGPRRRKGHNTACWPVPAEDLITPADRFFTRSHAATPCIDPAAWQARGREGWSSGRGSSRWRSCSARFPGGRSRPRWSAPACAETSSSPSDRFPGELPWGPEPVSTGRWSGVAMADLLRAVGGLARGAPRSDGRAGRGGTPRRNGSASADRSIWPRR